MKTFRVEGTSVSDCKKLHRGPWTHQGSVMIVGLEGCRHQKLIPIIDDNRDPEVEDNFEVVPYTEAELKGFQEMGRKAKRWRWAERDLGSKAKFDPEIHVRHFNEPDVNFRLKFVPSSDDPRVLVSWRVFNCKQFEGKAEVLCVQSLPYTYREDDGCYDVSVVNQLECLAIFKPGDTLRTVPIDPKGMYTSNISSASWRDGYVYFMHWMKRNGKPFLSVTRKNAEAVERRKAKSQPSS